jgi:alcohol dehydrogenase
LLNEDEVFFRLGKAMADTYRAMEIEEPGKLALVTRPVPEPGEGDVLIAVEACGVCGADKSDIEAGNPGARRVPGHEVVGKIIARGPGVPCAWEIGSRVGVGRLGGPCLACPACRGGKFQLCRNQPMMGASQDGGYAECMIVRATGLVSIPETLSSENAAPILCAGLATFNGLKASGAEPGDTIAVLGIGGLGHMAVQYARRMGYRVIAIGRGQDIATTALELGAHCYVDTDRQDAVSTLSEFGGAAALLTTTGDAKAIEALLPGLAAGGRLVLLGVGQDPLTVSTGFMIGGERKIVGSITGSPFDNERAMNFSVLTGVRPMIETLPLERAQEAYERMKTGQAKFRMVLTMRQENDA